MEMRKGVAIGFLAAILFMSCAGFAFKFYGLAQVNYEAGMLLGPSAKEDLPFSACEPTVTTKHPCVVMFTAEFFKLKVDYESTQARLSACEKGTPK